MSDSLNGQKPAGSPSGVVAGRDAPVVLKDRRAGRPSEQHLLVLDAAATKLIVIVSVTVLPVPLPSGLGSLPVMAHRGRAARAAVSSLGLSASGLKSMSGRDHPSPGSIGYAAEVATDRTAARQPGNRIDHAGQRHPNQFARAIDMATDNTSWKSTR